MTIKQLKEILNKYPDNYEVVLEYDLDNDVFASIGKIININYTQIKNKNFGYGDTTNQDGIYFRQNETNTIALMKGK